MDSVRKFLSLRNKIVKENKKMTESKKVIELNGVHVNYDKLTTAEMIQYIEECHPEDKKKFASLVFAKAGAPYNHFRARKIFCEMYFPQVLAKKEEVPNVSDIIAGWLN